MIIRITISSSIISVFVLLLLVFLSLLGFIIISVIIRHLGLLRLQRQRPAGRERAGI